MTIGPRPQFCCSFCNTDIGECEVMFRSHIGGQPPMVCSDCIVFMAEVVALNRTSPELTAELIAARNEVAERNAQSEAA